MADTKPTATSPAASKSAKPACATPPPAAVQPTAANPAAPEAKSAITPAAKLGTPPDTAAIPPSTTPAESAVASTDTGSLPTLPAPPATRAAAFVTRLAAHPWVLKARPVVARLDQIRSRLSPRLQILLLVVLAPTLLSLFYFGVWASPMYIAEARFAVRGPESSGMGKGIASLLLPAGISVGVDSHVVAEYIHSPDIMEVIDKEIHIFDHFASHEYDIISRLASDATRDKRLSYWQWAVETSLDPETGIIALKVKTYDPATAKKLADVVLAKSEALVNAMSRRAQDDAITLALNEVKTAEGRVTKAQEAMRDFRDRNGILDPVSTAGGLQSIVSQLEGEVVKIRSEIAEASTYMSKDAPALVGLRARLVAVEKQLTSEKLRLAGQAQPGSLTSFAGEYEDLQIESKFAREQLVSAMQSLEVARVKAEAKSRYVVAFQIPALPDESLYPRPFLFTAYVFVGILVLACLCSLILAAVREHAGF